MAVFRKYAQFEYFMENLQSALKLIFHESTENKKILGNIAHGESQTSFVDVARYFDVPC